MFRHVCQTFLYRKNYYRCYQIISLSTHKTLDKPPNFIATPIFYVNSVPHLGHLYTTVYADAIYRFSKLVQPLNGNQIFSTGTDEHGLKVQRSAEIAGQEPLFYCDNVSEKFRQLFQLSDVSYTHYMRTTDEQHKHAVKELWNTLLQNGFIYKSIYKGFYSVSDETFVPEESTHLNSDGTRVSTESGQPVEWHQEENYMFRLSAVQDQLVDWINNRLIMKPENFYEILKTEIRNLGTLHDISVSRSRSRLKWGIEVPNDSKQVIYVWFDALINYLTAAGYPNSLQVWPSAHLIGKDILKFHAIYWPAFLIAAKLQPPELIYCHSHWLYEEKKMSKSLGNVVDPYKCVEQFTSDGIRYFLMKEGTPQSDSNFNMEKVKICLNADLANTFGNLLNRCTSLKLNSKQHFTYYELDDIKRSIPEANEIVKTSQTLASNCYQAYLDGNFYIGINQIMDYLRMVNGLMTITEPWKMVKQCDQQDRLDMILYITLESIRIASVLLQPIIPRTSEQILDKLNVHSNMRTWESVVDAFRQTQEHQERQTAQLKQHKYVLFSKLQ